MFFAEKEKWFTVEQLANMIAISESTPGPVGINMATFSGFHAAGILGGIVASFAIIIPSLVIIIFIAKFLENFSENKYVKGAFFGIRPAVTAMISVAIFELFKLTLITKSEIGWDPHWKLIIFAIVIFCCMQLKQMKKLHPAIWFAVGAVVGIIFKF
jgi:chromate transporter